MSFRYPFPDDPGAERQVATVTLKVQLDDGREVTYVGSATRADYAMLPGGDTPQLDTDSPSGVAQSHRSTIDWVAGTVFRLSPEREVPAALPAAVQRAIEAS